MKQFMDKFGQWLRHKGQSGNSKAVEEAEKNIPKSAKAKQNVQM